MKRPLVIAHRGAGELAPENTAEAFRRALNLGADILETDTRLTADGHLVLCHDESFFRLGGPQRDISQLSRNDLRSVRLNPVNGIADSPLFLEDALEVFPDARFNVDLKDKGPDIVSAWINLQKRCAATERTVTASFHDANLALYRRLCPGYPVSLGPRAVLRLLTGAILGRPGSPRIGEGVLQIPEQSGVLRVLTRKRLNQWQRAGWKVQVWTVDNEEDMTRLARWGVDGIMTNRPGLLVETLGTLDQEEDL